MDHFFLNPARAGLLTSHARDLLNATSLAGVPPTQMMGLNRFSEENISEYEIKNGTAVIPVCGSLASTLMSGWRWYGSVSYENLADMVEHAVYNHDVDRILLRCYSPGGAVTGCAEAAERLNRLSDIKPLWAHCTMADSAAYWLASAANRIIVDPTGEVGSIGVVMTHMDISKMLDTAGVKVTHIFAGAHKADGSPFIEMSEQALARFQEDIDLLADQFINSVAKNRGIDADVVRQTEARTYQGQSAVDAGLADEVGFFTDILNQMPERTASGNPTPRKDKIMGKKLEKDLKASEKEEDLEVDDTEGEESDEKEASRAGKAVSAERARIGAIINCEEAVGREELAKSLAINSSMSVEEAKQHLSAAPKAGIVAENALAAAMKTVENPSLTSDAAAELPKNDNPLLASQQKFRAKAK